jgi:hypothetical protein
MTIDATQTQGLTRDLTRDTLSAGPRGKVELKSDDDKKAEGTDGEKSFSLFGDDDLSFWDVLDVFNPLQHIPLLSSVYREVTGDTIKPAAKLIGGTLFGGVYGLAAASVDVAVQGTTGKDIGEHAIALATGEPDEPGAAIRLANEAREKDPTQPWKLPGDAVASLAAAAPDAVADAAPETPEPEAAAPDPAPLAAAVAAPAAAAKATTKVSAAKASGDIPLPTWEDPPAANALAALSPAPAKAVSAASAAAKREGKSYPMPQRHNSYADSPKPIGEVRANASSSTSTARGSALPSGLTEQAMRAAGLTPDQVQQAIAAHGTTASAAQTAEIGSANSAGGVDSMWFYSAMNQALDKYRAAGNLAGTGDTISAASSVE